MTEALNKTNSGLIHIYLNLYKYTNNIQIKRDTILINESALIKSAFIFSSSAPVLSKQLSIFIYSYIHFDNQIYNKVSRGTKII